jgi:predicted CXXCH cytochrome family protein
MAFRNEEVHSSETQRAADGGIPHQSPHDRKEVGTVRRSALLLAGATLWLFLAAVPVLADGGVHVASSNSGVSTLTADSCAGCHRAHTAQGEYLINQPSVQALCLNCHGASATGATADVMTGVQYALALGVGVDPRDTSVIIGALRGGGFDQARIDSGNMSRLSYLRSATAVSTRPKIGVLAAPVDVTSAHIAMTANGLTNPGYAWGNGEVGSGVGPAATVTCGSCHNPHGNGQYRILNTFPEATGIDDAWVVDIIATVASNDRLYTDVSHGLLVGDVVTIAGTGTEADGANRTVATAASGSSGSYFTLTGIDITTDTGNVGGTVTRTSGVPVTDASLPAAGDERNYTVMQVKGTEGDESTYLLYASDVLDARSATPVKTWPAGDYSETGGDYFVRNVPWNPGINDTCDPTVFPLQAGCSTANSAPNGLPSTFSAQITAWCASCHTRYLTNYNVADPDGDPTDVAHGWEYARPGEDIFVHQHSTSPGRDCLTCHVSHGSNAAMEGYGSTDYSSNYLYPDFTTSSNSSRLLKVDNRGTCQACHDPTGTVVAGAYLYYQGGVVVEDDTAPYQDMAPVP